MKTALIAFLFVLPAIWIPASPSASEGAKCAVSSFEIEFERSEEVFVGTVTGIEKSGDESVATFRLEKYWKGSGSRIASVSVYENPKFQSPFREGGRFLVFAKPDEEESGKLYDGRCSRTTDLDRNPERAEDDLAKLGPGTMCKGDGERCE